MFGTDGFGSALLASINKLVVYCYYYFMILMYLHTYFMGIYKPSLLGMCKIQKPFDFSNCRLQTVWLHTNTGMV